MEQENIIKASKTLVDALINFVRSSQRILYPGIAVALFIQFRYKKNLFESSVEGVPTFLFAILIGTLVYFTYKGILHRIIWWIQSKYPKYGIPQYEIHKRIFNELVKENANLNPIKRETLSENISFSQACLGQFQDEILSDKKKSKHWGFNAGSHLLYLTSTLAIGFLLHDLLLYNQKAENFYVDFISPGPTNLFIWFLLIILGLVAGVMFDRHADFKEAIQIVNNEKRYRDILQNIINIWPEAQTKSKLSFILFIFKLLVIFAIICLGFFFIGQYILKYV